jgi:hypothetical protein
VKTLCFKKIQKLFPLGNRLLFIYPLIVEQPGYIDPVIVSTPHFQKSPLVFTQPGPKTEVQPQTKTATLRTKAAAVYSRLNRFRCSGYPSKNTKYYIPPLTTLAQFKLVLIGYVRRSGGLREYACVPPRVLVDDHQIPQVT